MENDKAQLWAVLCHLISFCGYLGVPFGNILGPLVIWLIFRDESRLVDEHGRESLNFQISITLYGVIFGIVAWLVAVLTLGLGALIILPIAALLLLAVIIAVIMAAVDAKNGKVFRYPFTIRFL